MYDTVTTFKSFGDIKNVLNNDDDFPINLKSLKN